MAIALFPAAAQAAAPTSVPVGVDQKALAKPTTGTTVAGGVLHDAKGRAAKGQVAVLAWPSEAYYKDAIARLAKGESATFETPTIGWTSTAANGKYSVSIDSSKVPAGYVGIGGQLNLELIGWTGTNQGRWAVSTGQSNDGGVAQMSSSVASAPRVTDPVTITADQPIAKLPTSTSATASGHLVAAAAATPYPGGGCLWSIQSTSTIWVNFADTDPRTGTASVSIGANHTVTEGVAYSSTGTYGSWTQSGSSGVTKGYTYTSNFYRTSYVYQMQTVYAKAQRECFAAGTVLWLDYAEFPTYDTAGINTPTQWPGSFNYRCSPQSVGGTLTRDDSGYHATSFSSGVNTGNLLGINLKATTDYSDSSGSQRRITYSWTGSTYFCGDNDYPSYSSRLREANSING